MHVGLLYVCNEPKYILNMVNVMLYRNGRNRYVVDKHEKH